MDPITLAAAGKLLAGTGGKLLASIGGKEALAKGLTTIAPYAINFLNNNTAIENAQAYQDYLNQFSSGMADTLQGRATSYEGKLGDMASQAENQYTQEAYTPLLELNQMKTDIANQSAEAQRQNKLQVQNQLNTSGVRGGQAAILQNRATGELNRDLQRDVNSLAYNEAASRQNSRLNYYGQKALTPWSDLSGTYGANSRYASAALSGAQGDALSNAYNYALQNYMNTRRNSNTASILGAGNSLYSAFKPNTGSNL